MKKSISAIALTLVIGNTHATVIDIYEFTALINADEIVGDSLIDRQIFNPGLSPENTFGSAGLAVSFTNNLNANNFGTATWGITNNSGTVLNNVQFYGFLDAEIDESINSFFNESGDASSLVLGSGSADSLADSWGIGDPYFDNIFTDLLNSNLTNTNTAPVGAETDVSLALGFDLGVLGMGESFSVTFDLSPFDNSGLLHYDKDSNAGAGAELYFNGIAINTVAQVPLPGTLALLALGFLGMRFFHRGESV